MFHDKTRTLCGSSSSASGGSKSSVSALDFLLTLESDDDPHSEKADAK